MKNTYMYSVMNQRACFRSSYWSVKHNCCR